MELKKKETIDHKSKKTFKELKMLMPQKRLLNVVLSRDILPLAAPVLLIAKKNPDDSQSAILNEDSDNKGGSVSDKDNKEVIMYKPETSLQTVHLDQHRDITSGNQSFKINPTLQPSPSNEKRGTHKFPIEDFRSLIRAATEQAIIKLSIDNPDVRNLQADSLKDIIFDELDSEPITKLFCKSDIDIATTTHLIKKQEEKQPQKSFTEVDQQCSKLVSHYINENNTGFSDNHIILNNSTSTSELSKYTNQEKRAKHTDKTYTNTTTLKKQVKRKDKTRKKLTADSDQRKDQLILKFEKRGKEKAVKRKIHNETEKNKQYQKRNQPDQKDYQPVWKIKKGHKSFLKNKVQIEPTVDTSHANQNKSEQFSSEPNNNGINTLPSKNIFLEGQDQPNFQDVFTSTLEMKRNRGRPLKKKLLKNETEKAYDVSKAKVNYDVSPVNVSSDTKKNEGEEVNNKINETKKRNATEWSEEKGPNKQKTVREKKSIELQLQLLRKQISCLSRSQNRILTILEHSLHDRSELLGKTLRFEGVASF